MGNEGSKSKGSKPPGGSSAAGGVQGVISGLKPGPSSATVTKHLDTAKKSRVLQLKAANLKKLPEAILEVADVLRNLELSQNRISELPPFIGDFAQLKQLHLSSNLLTSLPDEIGMLKNLEILNLAGNKLTSLPDSTVGCGSLRNINLSSNSFTKFPNVLAHLRDVDNVNLSQNAIQELPDTIETLGAMELNLNQNRLSSLPSSLSKCLRLKILRVEENCLEKTAFSKDLLENSQIGLIAYAGNLFQDRDFHDLPGYETYQERYTATRRKM